MRSLNWVDVANLVPPNTAILGSLLAFLENFEALKTSASRLCERTNERTRMDARAQRRLQRIRRGDVCDEGLIVGVVAHERARLSGFDEEHGARFDADDAPLRGVGILTIVFSKRGEIGGTAMDDPDGWTLARGDAVRASGLDGDDVEEKLVEWRNVSLRARVDEITGENLRSAERVRE